MQVRPNENDFNECKKFIENTIQGDFKFISLN